MSKALDNSDYERMQKLFELLFKWEKEPGQHKILFRKLSLRFHPDKNQADHAKMAFQALNEVYESLKQ